MTEENKEIKIVGINIEAINSSSDKKDCWIIPFKLSFSTDDSWQKKFYGVQQKDNNTMKRKATINQDTLKVEVSDTDDLQKVLDVLKAEVVETNVLCEEDYQKKIKIREELVALKKKEQDTTAKFKDDSKNLTF